MTADDAVWLTPDALRWQRDICLLRAAPTAAELLDAVASHPGACALLPATTRFGDLIGLRVMGVLHRLALQRRVTSLAMCLPTLGGTSPLQPDTPPRARAAFRADVVQALLDHPDELGTGLARVPQTNETGRAAVLRAVLSDLALAFPDLPVRLAEPGCSAGLNLRADHLPGLLGLEVGPLPQIVERRGCDLDPVDVDSPEGRLWLSGFVWVDDVERFAALAAALRVAQAVPAAVDRAEAGDFVAGLAPQPGSILVVWHSALQMYLDPHRRAGLAAALDDLAAQASPQAPVAHVAWEWAEGGATADFALTCRVWAGRPDDGAPVTLLRGASHGRPVERVGSLTSPSRQVAARTLHPGGLLS